MLTTDTFLPRQRLLRSATVRVSLIYVLLFGGAAVALLGLVYLAADEIVARQNDATVQAEIQGLAEQYRQQGMGRLVEIVALRSRLAGGPAGIYLLTDPQQRPLAGNLDRWPNPTEDEEGWIRFRVDHGDSGFEARGRQFVLPGSFRLIVARVTTDREQLREAMLQALVAALAVTVGLGVVGGLLLSRSLLRRVEAVAGTSRRIMQGQLSERVPVTGSGDEFDQLSGSLNSMLDRIEELMTGLRVVSDSLSHDLRSPLTRLKGRIEAALRDPAVDGDARRALEQTLADTDTILATFNALLSIAEAEAGLSRRGADAIDLASLASDLADLYQPAAEEQGLTLFVDIAPDTPPCVFGHRDLLVQAVANLLDNALKYTPSGGRVWLTVQPGAGPGASPGLDPAPPARADAPVAAARAAGPHLPGSVVIRVADTGPGIPAADRDRVVQRFVRLDASRSQPGSGLGLSLAAAVAKLHGADLVLGDNPREDSSSPGLTVTFILPPSATTPPDAA